LGTNWQLLEEVFKVQLAQTYLMKE